MTRLRISVAVLRHVGARQRIDVHDHHVGRGAFVDQRKDRRVAHVAAVPVGLAVDLHRLEQERQAGRGHHRVGRDLGIPEHAHLARAHVGGAQEQLDRRAGAQAREVDRLLEDVLQRVEVQGIELVGREHAHQQVEGLERRAEVEPVVVRQAVDQRGLQRRGRRPPGRCAARSRRAPCARPRCRPRPSRRPAPWRSWRRRWSPRCPRCAIRPSSSSLSSTPQAKAPCAPPPCSARLMVLVSTAPWPPRLGLGLRGSAVRPPWPVAAAILTRSHLPSLGPFPDRPDYRQCDALPPPERQSWLRGGLDQAPNGYSTNSTIRPSGPRQ